MAHLLRGPGPVKLGPQLFDQFTLRPLDRSLRNQVPWVFLSIDPKTERLVALELELRDKSRIRSVFGKPEINGNPDPSLFTVDLSGLKVR